ncbi:TVP38/TMEM64 family protein [Pseudonocardia nigra]|uniref:TVP38/TMEM64 family protein n=1 Tax=Pseudonocardia nigra TaxID=1921578 RepID=UPI001C5CE0CE|nr:VTT domain-containing protein [Pseudonocardia nigra]
MRGPWLRAALLLALLAAGVAGAVRVGVPPVAQLRAWVAAAGWAAPLAFAALYAALGLTPVPLSVLSIAAGLLFGLPVGLAAVMGGAIGAAAAGFALARGLGRSAAQRLGGAKLARVDAVLRRRGVLAVVAVRLVPVLPFTALNLACGLAGVRTRDYLAGTAVGILPGATAYVAIGAFGDRPGSLPFWLAVGGFVVLVVGGIAVGRRRRRAARPA